MITRVGHYEILSELGRGASGSVYRAHDSIGRNVALKILTAKKDPDALSRFLAEAALFGSLRHKNIVTVFAYGEHEGSPYVVTELLEGETLQQMIARRAPLSLLIKVRILYQIAEGLSAAHRRGVIHRDIKPANIMVLPNDDVKIMDFGDAQRTQMTRAGVLIGAVRYLSPESINGVNSDALSDIFSFGVVGYEWIAGHYPFEGANIANVLSNILSSEPRELQEFVPGCPATLDRVIRRAMAKDRELRYQAMDDLLFDLEPILRELAQEHAAGLMEQAEEMAARGEIESALGRTREILALDPSNRKARSIREALQSEKQRSALRPRVEELFQRAQMELRQRNFGQAVQHLESALRLDESDPRLAALFSAAKAGMEANDRAQRLLSEARVQMRTGNLEAAYENARAAHKVDPQNPDAQAVEDALRAQIVAKREEQVDRQQNQAIAQALERAHSLASALRFDEALVIIDAAQTDFGTDPRLVDLRRQVEAASGQQERRATRDIPALDHVQFTITAPSAPEPGESFELYFWVHLEEQRKIVMERAMLSLGISKPEHMVTKSEGPVPLARGTVVSARVSIDGMNVDPSEKRVVWSGDAGCASFVISVPPTAQQRQYHGTVSIRVNSCEIARMDFLLRVSSQRGQIPATLKRHETAFASYASEDRDAVLARVQGMQKVAPWLKVFMDAVDLRSGELWKDRLCKEIQGSDIFYLFWCRHARASEWVEHEWRYAYETRGEIFIDPVPLESPQNAPPPDELKTKHFNDLWTELQAKAHGS